MDKQTLSNYGWIVVLTLILAVLLALASPLGSFIAGAFKATYAGFDMAAGNALSVIGIGNGGGAGDVEENKLAKPTLNWDGAVMTVNPVENAEYYDIYVDGELLGSFESAEIIGNEANFADVLEDGTYMIYVIARAADGSELAQSDPSDVKTLVIGEAVTSLPTPEIIYAHPYFNITNYGPAENVDLYLEMEGEYASLTGEFVPIGDILPWDMTDTIDYGVLEMGKTYNFKVVTNLGSINSDPAYATITIGNSTHNIERLPAPTNLAMTPEGVFSFDGVANAHGYRFYLEGIQRITGDMTSYNFAEDFHLAAGTYTVGVVAIGDVVNYLDSDMVTIEFTTDGFGTPCAHENLYYSACDNREHEIFCNDCGEYFGMANHNLNGDATCDDCGLTALATPEVDYDGETGKLTITPVEGAQAYIITNSVYGDFIAETTNLYHVFSQSDFERFDDGQGFEVMVQAYADGTFSDPAHIWVYPVGGDDIGGGSCSHDGYSTFVADQQDGTHATVCENCWSVIEGSVEPHNYVDGVCDVCNALVPCDHAGYPSYVSNQRDGTHATICENCWCVIEGSVEPHDYVDGVCHVCNDIDCDHVGKGEVVNGYYDEGHDIRCANCDDFLYNEPHSMANGYCNDCGYGTCPHTNTHVSPYDFTDTEHTLVCSNDRCNEVIGTEPHTIVNKECSKCAYAFPQLSKPISGSNFVMNQDTYTITFISHVENADGYYVYLENVLIDTIGLVDTYTFDLSEMASGLYKFDLVAYGESYRDSDKEDGYWYHNFAGGHGCAEDHAAPTIEMNSIYVKVLTITNNSADYEGSTDKANEEFDVFVNGVKVATVDTQLEGHTIVVDLTGIVQSGDVITVKTTCEFEADNDSLVATLVVE